MRILQKNSYDELSSAAADIIAAQLMLKPDSVLGLATGSTPIGAYKKLVEMRRSGRVYFTDAIAFNLDEYRGLPPDAEQSYAYFMKKNLFSHVGMPLENINIPDGLAEDPEKECLRYEEKMYSCGGIDLQLLGIGANGHIGFNEPGTSFITGTHLVDLSDSTIQANSRFFNRKEDVPTQAFTMGIRAIMQARKILLLATGEGKAEILYKALFGPVTPKVPASILQLHKDVVVIGDVGALSQIMKKLSRRERKQA